MARAALLAIALVATSLLTPASTGQLLAEFHFQTLLFTYHPEGLGSGPAGSTSLETAAQDVRVEGSQATELRQCIDGHPRPKCPYGDQLAIVYTAGNRDDQVSTQEVESFERIAPLAMATLPKVRRLTATLKDNVTIDGFASAATPRVADVQIEGAEGSVTAAEPVLIDVLVETHYENDRKAKRHEIRVHNFHIQKERFYAFAFEWRIGSAKAWEFVPAETRPLSIKDYTHADNYHSSQGEFEAASNETIVLVVEQPSGFLGGGEDFNWLWVVLPAAALIIVLVAVLTLRRKK